MHQSKMFNLLTSMKFFRYFLIIKQFMLWRKNVRYRHYISKRRHLSHWLFFAKPVFTESFAKINEQLYSLTTTKMLELNENRTVELPAYTDEQRDARNDSKKEFENTIELVIADIDYVIQAVK